MPKNIRVIHSDLFKILAERDKINRRNNALLGREKKLLMELKRCLASECSLNQKK